MGWWTWRNYYVLLEIIVAEAYKTSSTRFKSHTHIRRLSVNVLTSGLWNVIFSIKTFSIFSKMWSWQRGIAEACFIVLSVFFTVYFLNCGCFHIFHMCYVVETASVVLWLGFLATDPKARVRFTALPGKKSSGSGMGSTQPREYNWGGTW
jgi:hypothetical protein